MALILEDDVDKLTNLLGRSCFRESRVFTNVGKMKVRQELINSPSWLAVAAFFGAKKVFNALLDVEGLTWLRKEGERLDLFAARGGNFDICRMLERVRSVNWDLESCQAAVKGGHLEIVSWLWTRGVLNGITADDSAKLLFLAASMGRRRLLEFLADEVGLDLASSFRHPVWDPLEAACEEGYFECVEFLVKRGAPLDVVPLPALTLAIEAGSLPCVRILLEYGATVPGEDPPTVLAAFFGCLDILRFLVDECGIDPSLETTAGVSPLAASIVSNSASVENWLREFGSLLVINDSILEAIVFRRRCDLLEMLCKSADTEDRLKMMFVIMKAGSRNLAHRFESGVGSETNHGLLENDAPKYWPEGLRVLFSSWSSLLAELADPQSLLIHCVAGELWRIRSFWKQDLAVWEPKSEHAVRGEIVEIVEFCQGIFGPRPTATFRAWIALVSENVDAWDAVLAEFGGEIDWGSLEGWAEKFDSHLAQLVRSNSWFPPTFST